MIKERDTAVVTDAAIGARRLILAAGLLLALLVAGCAERTGNTTQPLASTAPAQSLRSPGAPQVHPRWLSCAKEPSAQHRVDENRSALPRLADSFHPVAAIICAEASQRRPDGGTNLVATEDRIDDVGSLINALQLPDGAPTTMSCTLDAVLGPWLALLDAEGHWVRPGIPVDACHKPRAEVMTAVDKARRTRTATRVLHEIESAGAAATGCSDEWADMVWVTGTDSNTATRPTENLAQLADDHAPVHVCVYRVPASEQRTDKPVGEIVSRTLLPAGRWAAIKRQLQAAGPVRACSTPASRFALLLPGEIYVELDGCRRILAPAAPRGDGTSSDTLRQAPAALLDLLTKP